MTADDPWVGLLRQAYLRAYATRVRESCCADAVDRAVGLLMGPAAFSRLMVGARPVELGTVPQANGEGLGTTWRGFLITVDYRAPGATPPGRVVARWEPVADHPDLPTAVTFYLPDPAMK